MANPIMSVVLFFLVGLTMGVGVLLSQQYGAGQRDKFRVQFSTGLIGGIVFTLAVAAVCIPLSGLMLRAAQTPGEILEPARQYLQIVFGGMIFSFLYNYYASALRSIGDSRTAFLYLVLSSVLNIVLGHCADYGNNAGSGGSRAGHGAFSGGFLCALCLLCEKTGSHAAVGERTVDF